jgi:hypothetical protein
MLDDVGSYAGSGSSEDGRVMVMGRNGVGCIAAIKLICVLAETCSWHVELVNYRGPMVTSMLRL